MNFKVQLYSIVHCCGSEAQCRMSQHGALPSDHADIRIHGRCVNDAWDSGREVGGHGGHGSRMQSSTITVAKLPSKILQAKASHLMSSLMVPKGEQWCTSVPVVDL